MDWTQTGVEQTQAVYTLLGASGTVAYDTGVLDMRAFASYYLNITAETLAAGTKYNTVNVQYLWLDGPTSATATRVMYETYSFFMGSTQVGTFQVFGGTLQAQDQVHAPYLRIIVAMGVVTPNAQDPATSRFVLIGTTRGLTTPSIREIDRSNSQQYDNWIVAPNDGQLLAVGVGNSKTVAGRLRYSAARWRLVAGQPFTLAAFDAVNQTINFESFASAAAGTFTGTLYMPHASTLWTVTNNSASPADYRLTVVSEEVRMR